MPETTQFPGVEGVGSYSSLQANTVLLSRYKILGVVGGGGQGSVYQARDLNFPDVRKLVAVKEMLNPATDPNLRASKLRTFQREANILATLSHPAIPKIFDFFDRNDRAYLVMEFITGSDLEVLLSKTKELPIDKIIEWAIDLCDVLEYLHNHQPDPIIFRDIKPSNIMIDSLGKVRLIDFGIAKTFVPNVKHTMIGTEGYSAPEQYKGNVTPLSDIYSLGATLHHVLTRKDPRLEPPFSFNERPIRDFNPKAPPELVAIVERAVEFDPAKRFQSCAEMKAALERLRYRPLSVGSVGAVGKDSSGETDFFEGIEQLGELQPRWKFTTEDEIRAGPTTVGELAYVGSYDTNMWCVRLDNGEFVWKYATNGGIATSPVIEDTNRLVLFGSEDYSFTALDYRTGRISWSFTTRDRIRSTAAIAHGRVFFGSDDGRVYALMASNGRHLWNYDMSAPVRVRPFIADEVIIVGSEAGDVTALSLSGDRKWGFRAKRAVTASPYVDPVEKICFIASADYYVYALDVETGYSSWRFRTNGPVFSSPTVADGLLYFGSADGYLYAVNVQTSKERWKFSTGKPIVSAPVVHKGAVYFGGTDEYFYCVDAQTGKERWKFKTGGPITSKAHIAGDLVLIGSMDKTLYALPLVG
ncbi:MAG: beta-alanine-activating enzyme beta-propeller domain-containing protein [Aggregatilineales bacterium]